MERVFFLYGAVMSKSYGTNHVLLNAVATGSATRTFRTGSDPQQGFHHHIQWATGVTAGTVVIECAESPTYAGTWATLATVANNGGGTAYEDYVYTPGQPGAIRHRISVAVSGGGAPTVTTTLVGTPA